MAIKLRQLLLRTDAFKIPRQNHNVSAVTCLALIAAMLWPSATHAEQQTLRVGFFDNPPIVFKDTDGAPTGLSIEVLESIAEREGWQLEYDFGPWSEVYTSLQQGELDLLVGIAYSEQRAEQFDFTDETVINNWGMVYQGHDSNLTSLEHLQGQRVALMKNSIHSRVFKKTMAKFGFAFEVVDTQSYAGVLAAVQAGEAQAGVINRVFSLTHADQYAVKPTSIIFNPVHVRYAAPRGGRTELLARLDSQLAQAKGRSDSFYYDAVDRWLGAVPTHSDFKWLVYLLLSVVSLFLLAILYSYSVRRQVKLRTAQLADSEERFRQIAEYVSEVFWIGTPDWQKILYINPAYERVWGRSCEGLYAQPMSWFEAIHEDDKPAVSAALARKVGGDLTEPAFPAYRILRPDGTVRWILARTYPVKNNAGTVMRLIGYAQDITDFKHTEQALRESEQRYRNLLEIAQEGIWVFDTEGMTTYVNPAMAEMLNYEVQEMYGLPIQQFMSGSEYELAKAQFTRHEKGVREQHDFELLTKDGDSIYVAMEVAPIFDHDHHNVGVIAGVMNLTSRREAEEELKKSEARYRTIIEHAPEAIVVFDAQRGHFVDANRNAEQLFKISREQLLEVSPFELSPAYQPDGSDSLQLAREYVERTTNGEVPIFEWWHKDTEGREFPCEIRLVCLPGPDQLVRGSVIDITERKEIERALQQSEERFELAVNGSQDGLWDWHISDEESLWWSPRMFELLGYEPQAFEPTFQRFIDDVHPEDRNHVTDQVSRHLDRHSPYDIEFRMRTNEGTYRWFRARGRAQWDEAGNPIRMAGSLQDINEQRTATESLRMYQHIVSASRDFMAFVDREYRYRAANDTYRRAFGKEMDSIIGASVEDLFGTEQFRTKIKPTLDRAFAGETGRNQQWYSLPESGERYLDANVHPHWDHKGEVTGVVIDVHDLTNMKQAEDALQRSELRYSQSQRAARVGSWEWDINTGEVFWSEMVAPLFGIDADDFEGTLQSFIDHVHPDDRQRVLDALEDAIASKHAYSIEHRVVAADGQVRWIHEYGDLVYADTGEVQGMAGIVQDITERKVAEQSQRRLMQILDKTPDFVGMADPDGKVFYINPAGQALMGFAAHTEVTDTYIEDYLPEDVYQQVREECIPYAARHGVWRGEAALQTRHGERIPILQTIIAHKASGGKLEYLSTVARDIRERKKVEETLRALAEEGVGNDFDEFIVRLLRYLTQVYNARYVLMGLLDGEENKSITTQAVWIGGDVCALQSNFSYELKGTPCQDVLNRAKELIPQDAAAQYPDDELLQSMKIESYFGAPLVISNGETIGILSVMDSEPMHPEPWQASLLGIFASRVAIEWERKQALDELNRHRENLEELVSERTADLEAVNKELEAFSYSVSHDLRAPLRAVDGFSQALFEDYYEQFDPQARDYLERVRRGAQRMGQLIEDLLQLSRISRAQLLQEEVDLGSIVEQCFEKLQQDEPRRRISLDIRAAQPLRGKGDPRLLEIALNNLVSNAWKYTRQKEQACFEFGVQDRSGQRVFYLKDNGAGFDMRYANKLFAPFQRLHAPEEFEGIGVGLATVQRILHRHGGRIWAESKPGEGATFYFTLD